jgi:hypothetical protein
MSGFGKFVVVGKANLQVNTVQLTPECQAVYKEGKKKVNLSLSKPLIIDCQSSESKQGCLV